MERPSGLGSIARALRHRNYRLFFFGQTISLIGTWLARVAISWLIYRLTGSGLLLGVVSFASQAPTFFFAPLAGVWIDRLDRHRVLVITQVLAMVQSGLLAFLALTQRIDVPNLLVLSACQGLINVFDMPARQAFLTEMVVDRADLPNAVALNSSVVNVARLLGPSLAGVLIASVGEGVCFLIDALSYVAVIASLLAMRVSLRPLPQSSAPVWRELREGFAYVVGFGPIRAVLLLLTLMSVMGMPYTVLMPIIASRTLHGSADTLGFLMAASGLGALLGALYLASRGNVLGLGRIIVLTAGLFGLSLVGLSLSHTLWLSLLFTAVAGLSMMLQMAASNTILQTIVDDDKRGRVMSFYSMAVFGSMPFGSLIAGVLADRVGAAQTLLWGGLVCIVGASWFMRALPELRRQVRPIYTRLGILH